MKAAGQHYLNMKIVNIGDNQNAGIEKDTLRENLTVIEKWCTDNGISIFYGAIGKSSLTEILWKESGESDWEKYLQTASKAGIKIIVVDMIQNSIDTNDPNVRGFMELLEGEELKGFKDAVKSIKNRTGQIAFLKLTFIKENAMYGYSQFTDWVDDYLTVDTAFAVEDEDEDEEEY
jgi:hypothetical protein